MYHVTGMMMGIGLGQLPPHEFGAEPLMFVASTMIFVAFCTSVNWSYESQLSIWVKDYTILKCSHSKNIASQIPPFTILNCLIGKIYVGFFLSKTKNTVYFVVQYFTEKFWIDDYSYTKSIHNCPSNRYNICVVVWFILIMVTFFANRDQCIAYFNNYYNSWNFETYIFRIFIQDFETDR